MHNVNNVHINMQYYIKMHKDHASISSPVHKVGKLCKIWLRYVIVQIQKHDMNSGHSGQANHGNASHT